MLSRFGPRIRRSAASSSTLLPAAPAPSDPEDFQLALYLCYELHYGGLPGVPDEMDGEHRM